MSDATDKLARTREAIVVQLHGAQPRGRIDRNQERSPAASPTGKSDPGHRGWFGKLQRAAGMWWRRHPACTGLELAKPLLATYAAQKPVQFLGVAAAAGAVIVVARGWRLVSIAGVLAALIKSSPLSSFALAALAVADADKDLAQPAGD